MVFCDDLCFKHNKCWRSWIEWLMNQFRRKRKEEITANNLQMNEFRTAFMNLICTCEEDGQKKPHLKQTNDALWENISEDELKASVNELKNYNIDENMKTTVVEVLLKRLYDRGALYEDHPDVGSKGAYRLTYLLSKIILSDFSIFRSYKEELAKRKPKVFSIEPFELPVDKLDAFLVQGCTGSLLERFSNDHECTVTLKETQRQDDKAMVSGTVRKVANNEEDLHKIVDLLKTEISAERQQMEVDSNISSGHSMEGVESPASNVTQPFCSQTEPFTAMQELKTDSFPTLHAPPPASQNQSVSSLGTDTQSNSCLVHSLQWMPVYQFILTQCISRNMMSGRDGHNFSEKVCTCIDGQENTDIAEYFSSELDIQNKIRQVKEELKGWRNSIIVLHKFISELEKEQRAGNWQSLLKFVYHFLQLKNSGGNGAPRSGCGDR